MVKKINFLNYIHRVFILAGVIILLLAGCKGKQNENPGEKIPGDNDKNKVVLESRLAGTWYPDDKKSLKKQKQIPVSQWAEKHRIVPDDSSVPGKWKNATTPYLAGIMDASFFPSVQEFIICAPPQTGKSDCVNNCIGYGADRKRGNVLYVYPDELTARENSKDRIQPMFKDSPRLKQYLTGYEDDESVLRIKLRHMKVHLAWASSAARTSSASCRPCWVM